MLNVDDHNRILIITGEPLKNVDGVLLFLTADQKQRNQLVLNMKSSTLGLNPTTYTDNWF